VRDQSVARLRLLYDVFLTKPKLGCPLHMSRATPPLDTRVEPAGMRGMT